MDISSEIAAIQAASQGSELRQPLVGALNKLNSGSLPAVTASDVGKILKVGANGWEVGEKSGYMPLPTATKQITENGTHDVTNYAEAIVNVSGGGGGGNSLFWAGGDYYGDPLGSNTGSLNITLSGEIGQTAIIVIMHRSVLTVPSNFILIDNRKNAVSVTQEISIYKKVLANSSESYTITQADSSARMCMCYFIFSTDPNIAYDSVQTHDSVSTMAYTISKKNKPTLVVISNNYTTWGNDIINTMTPEQLCVTPKDQYRWFNSTSYGSVGFRFIVILNNSPSNLVINQNFSGSQNNYDTDRAFIYTIG